MAPQRLTKTNETLLTTRSISRFKITLHGKILYWKVHGESSLDIMAVMNCDATAKLKLKLNVMAVI